MSGSLVFIQPNGHKIQVFDMAEITRKEVIKDTIEDLLDALAAAVTQRDQSLIKEIYVERIWEMKYA